MTNMGTKCAISMPVMSATFSNSRSYARLQAQTGRSASHGTTRREMTDARMDGISNGATRRHGVYSMKSFTRGSPRCPNAALPLWNRRRSGPREHCFIVSRCRRVSRGARGGHGSGARSTGRTSYFSTRTWRRRRNGEACDLLGNPAAPQTRTGHRLHHLPGPKHDARRAAAAVARAIDGRSRCREPHHSADEFSAPGTAGSRSYVQRQRWFTVVDPDAESTVSAQAFATALASVPRVQLGSMASSECSARHTAPPEATIERRLGRC